MRHRIEDLIIEEEESGTNAEQLEHYDSRDGSGPERSGFEGDQKELEQWKAENEVEIDSKLIGAVPLPFTEFIELSEMIPDNIFRLVQKSGYEKPTPIQSRVRNHARFQIFWVEKLKIFVVISNPVLVDRNSNWSQGNEHCRYI